MEDSEKGAVLKYKIIYLSFKLQGKLFKVYFSIGLGLNSK
jgi:hypothetical protein